MTDHRRRKTSLRHPIFFDQEFNALSSIDACLEAARVGFEDVSGVLSNSLQAAREKNKKLPEELKLTKAKLDAAQSEVEGIKEFTREAHAEIIGQLEKDLKRARVDLQYVESQEQADRRVLAQSWDDKKKLKAENKQQTRDIESLKAQLAAVEESNNRTNQTISGLMTGQPQEATNSSSQDALTELSEVHGQSRRSMEVRL